VLLVALVLAVVELAVVELVDHKVLVAALAAVEPVVVEPVVVELDHKVRQGLAVEALGHKQVQLVVVLAGRKQVVVVLGS
jgi:hypothetical protein